MPLKMLALEGPGGSPASQEGGDLQPIYEGW